MALADDRQRIMSMPDDRMPGRYQELAYPEAVHLTNPINPILKGEVDDKYQYSCDNKENKVHGWVSLDPPIGFWQITLSDEFRTGRSVKQNLTSHVGPTTLAVLPVFLEVLPLKEDREESIPVYSCICNLVLSSNLQILPLVPEVIHIFAQVVASPAESDEVKSQICFAFNFLISSYGQQMQPIVSALPPMHASALAAFAR